MTTFIVVCCMFLVVCSCDGGGTQEAVTAGSHVQKRETTRLFPFPRVGRSRSEFPITWGYAYPDDKYKREGGLIPFPRVGRNDPKRNGAGGSSALWFGPRLGKVQKRGEWYNTMGLFNYPRIGRGNVKRNDAAGNGALWFGPRLGKIQKRISDDYMDRSLDYLFDDDDDADSNAAVYFLKKLKTGDISTENKSDS